MLPWAAHDASSVAAIRQWLGAARGTPAAGCPAATKLRRNPTSPVPVVAKIAKPTGSMDRSSPSLDRIYQLGLWSAIFFAIFSSTSTKHAEFDRRQRKRRVGKECQEIPCVRHFATRRRDPGWNGAQVPMHASPKRLAQTFAPHRAGLRRIPIPR
jgi:hypothetical protein